jgi:hypothetical protein
VFTILLSSLPEFWSCIYIVLSAEQKLSNMKILTRKSLLVNLNLSKQGRRAFESYGQCFCLNVKL